LSPEAQVRNHLAQSIPGSQTEVTTEFGRIDILTPTEVIEVKRATQWKQAIGQVEIYLHAYPNHRPRIHLFGKTKHKTMIQKLCKNKGIRCTFASEDT
jgi:RecB family endonuclease NucS